jgi:hypothetical protein
LSAITNDKQSNFGGLFQDFKFPNTLYGLLNDHVSDNAEISSMSFGTVDAEEFIEGS